MHSGGRKYAGDEEERREGGDTRPELERRVNGKDSRNATPRRFIDGEIDREIKREREKGLSHSNGNETSTETATERVRGEFLNSRLPATRRLEQLRSRFEFRIRAVSHNNDSVRRRPIVSKCNLVSSLLYRLVSSSCGRVVQTPSTQ